MLAHFRPGREVEPDVAHALGAAAESGNAAGPPIILDVPGHEPMDGVSSASTRAPMLVGVVLAVALHAGIALALSLPSDEPLGAGGRDLDAISIEVSVISASALESRERTEATDTASAASAVSQTDGAPEPSAAAPEVRPTESATEPTSEPQRPPPDEETASEPVEVKPEITAQKEPKEEPPASPRLTTTPDPTPPEPDAATLPAQPTEPMPTGTPVDEVVRPPDPLPEKPKPETTASPSPGSVAVSVGGASHSGTSNVERPSAAAAAAPPGAIRAFARSVVEALARSRPSGRNGRARGMVKVAFVVGSDGSLADARIVASSGHQSLDEAALAAVRKASFPRPPRGLTVGQRSYVMPYHFR